jgi:hypothetical protein
MTFFFAFTTAGFIGLGFALLAFRYARTLCFQFIAIFIFFVALPLATAWLYTGHMTSRALIGQDLYSTDLAAALTAHAHLYALYGLGVLAVATLLRDGRIAADIERTLSAQRFSIVWPALFVAAVLAEFLIRLQNDILISGSSTAERVADLSYLASSVLAVLGSVTFGLFCYVAVLSARTKALLIPCLAYLPFVLATNGRRETIMTLVTLLLLRTLSLGFRPNWRLAWIGGGALALFILVGPFFIEARQISLTLQATGTPPIAALLEGAGQALDNVTSGETNFGMVAANVAERGNAGVFLLTVASRNVEPQLGTMTWAAILWAVPSVFAAKPPLQVETMIQLVAGMLQLDDANSVPLTFYVDFGGFGMLLAGAYTALLLYGVAWLLRARRPFGIFEVVALGTFFSLSFGIENELVGHFTEIRNLALFAPFALLSRFLSGARKSAIPRGHRFERRQPKFPGAALAAPPEGQA